MKTKTTTLEKIKMFAKAMMVVCVIARYFAFFTLGCYTSLIIENGNDTNLMLGAIASTAIIVLTIICNHLGREME